MNFAQKALCEYLSKFSSDFKTALDKIKNDKSVQSWSTGFGDKMGIIGIDGVEIDECMFDFHIRNKNEKDDIKSVARKLAEDILKMTPNVPFKYPEYNHDVFMFTRTPSGKDLGIKEMWFGDKKVKVNNETESIKINITEDKYTPKTDKEKMLVEALLRKCRGEKVEFHNVYADELSPEWVSDGDSCHMNLGLKYRASPSKLDKLREEIETKLDTSALDVFDVILNEFDELREKLED